MDRIVELVGQLEPETAPPSADAQARQRAALFASMAAADEAHAPPSRWRHHRGWLLAIAGAAAAAVLVALVVPGLDLSRASHQPTVAPSRSAVLTAVTRALTDTSGDVEEVRSTVPVAQLVHTAWVNLASGACRTDTAVGGRLTLTVFVEDGREVIIDYGQRQWRTHGTPGVTCEPLTPQTITHDLAVGRYSVAGQANLDGKQALRLVSTTATPGPDSVTQLTTLWVDATTYLPIESTSTGHATEKTVFTWLPATATNKAVFKVTVPAGFHQVATPPSKRPAA
jgi:hypothetical protein